MLFVSFLVSVGDEDVSRLANIYGVRVEDLGGGLEWRNFSDESVYVIAMSGQRPVRHSAQNDGQASVQLLTHAAPWIVTSHPP